MADVEVPGYRLHTEIGRGARSRVYSASHHARGGTVAIKVTGVPSDDAEINRRFLEGGQAARRLEHPNIVRVLEVGKLDDAHYRVMEYMRGGDLDRNLANGLHLQNVLMATKDVAAGLDYAHDRGVIHGDLRPANILFDEQGAVRVSGFALPASTSGGPSPYRSPEHARDGLLSPRSDFFSLGVIFYQMLTGRLPDATPDRRGWRHRGASARAAAAAPAWRLPPDRRPAAGEIAGRAFRERPAARRSLGRPPRP